MPFNRPSIDDLVRRGSADVAARLPGTEPLLRRSVVGGVVRVVSGAHHELYGYVGWVARSVFADTAEGPELERQASIWGVSRIEAIEASGTMTVTGTTGAAVPVDSVWRRGDGAEYRVTAAAVLAAGTAAVSVEAREPGRAGNAAIDVKLSVVSPLPGVVSESTVSVAVAGGADAESDDGLRARLIERIQNPPRGGAASDYRFWAKSAHPDVTRRWVRPLAGGLGTVTVYFMTDDATANGIPIAAAVATVNGYIDARRPVTAAVTVSAPVAVALDVTIDMLDPDTLAVRAAVEAELADLIVREAEPGGTIRVTHIAEAISSAAGEIDHVLVRPAANVAHNANQIAVPGTVTWQ